MPAPRKARKKKIPETHDNHPKYTVTLPNGDSPVFLREIRKRLEERVVGQPRPIRRLIRGITTFYAKLNDPKRPVGVFMFAGSSGVGKSYLAEELAYALIGEPEGKLSPFVEIDCGSLSLEHTVASLTGAPPGYKGYGDPISLEMVGEYDRKRKGLGELDKRINEVIQEAEDRLAAANVSKDMLTVCVAELRRSLAYFREEVEKLYGPFRSVVLFDEIEKADMNIQSQLLRILDKGVLDLHNGRQVNFRGSIIILTTNVGTEQILKEHLTEEKIGFALPQKEKIEAAKDLDELVYRRVWKEIFNRKKGYFKQELLTRIGKPGIIVFHVLGYEDYQKIVDIRLEEFQNQFLSEQGPGPLFISYTQRFKDFLIQEGVSPVFGARALRDVIDRYVRTPVSEKILSPQEPLKMGDKILLDIEPEEEARTVITRQERPVGKTMPDFKTRDRGMKRIPNLDKVLDEFLENFLKELKIPENT